MMEKLPVIYTERLVISELKSADLPLVLEYLQEKAFSELTTNIPYPYYQEDAEAWLKSTKEAFEEKTSYIFAIRDKSEKIIGAIGLHPEDDDKAELGYWLGMPYWNQGYATEAGKAMLTFGFEVLNLNKIFATYFLHNPASGKVMEKIGMEKEALLKQHIKKRGEYLDILMYSAFKKRS